MATPTFKRLTLDQFAQLLMQFPFTRQINAVHLHHSQHQRQREFRGHASIVARWRTHTGAGLDDIAQHATLDPHGYIWLGRNWNRAPDSARGHNGNDGFGPFMLELAGDFSAGNDHLQGIQLESLLQVVAMLQERFALPLDSLLFHSDMADCQCPGDLDRENLLAGILERRYQGVLQGGQRNSDTLGDDPFPQEDDLFIRAAIDALLRSLSGSNHRTGIPESDNDEAAMIDHEQNPQVAARATGEALSAACLAAMRPYLVNLGQGSFAEGDYKSTPADIDAIFEQHLPRAVADASAAGQRLQLVMFACSGLQRESTALQIASQQIQWWKDNGVYPLYFIWESGIGEAIGNLIQRGVQGATGGQTALASDGMIESVCRNLGGPTLWNGIKYGAEHSVTPGGAASYIAAQLKAFCDKHPDELELHAIAHGTGALFHSHFLRCAWNQGIPRLASLQLLAPAVRIDTFQRQLGELIAEGELARRLTLFTLSRDYELADSCTSVYGKSLLCLIQQALEERAGTPLLGLEQSLRADLEIKQQLGLDGSEGNAEVVFAVTADDSGRSASCAATHNAFAEDPVTFNSLLLRVLDLPDASEVLPLPAPVGEDVWAGAVDWPQDVQQMQRGWLSDLFSRLFGSPHKLPSLPPPPSSPGHVSTTPVLPPSNPLPIPASTPSVPTLPPSIPVSTTPSIPAIQVPATSNRRIALCIGINAYPNPVHRLNGCVADAQMWSTTLSRLGFACSLLTDAQATRANIEHQLRALVGNARPGDVIVFMYSGHGTHVNDLNGDEDDGQDEALCPVDFEDGALFIDDDIASILAGLPAGVNLTMFTDCCHSGSNSRFAIGSDSGQPLAGDARPRYVTPSAELNEVHAAFRSQLPSQPRPAGSGGQENMNHVKFAACQDREVAWESNGHGEFTLRATTLLGQNPYLSHQQFIDRVTTAFGTAPRQHPLLDCSSTARSRQLFAPVASGGRGLEGVDPQLLNSTLQQIQLLLAQMNR